MIDEIAILQMMQTEGLGVRTLSRILEELRNVGKSLEEFVSLPPEELIEHYGLRHEIAESIQTHRRGAEQLAEELRGNEIQILTRESDGYPARLTRMLKETAPPVVFAWGDMGILARKVVGFCGPRNASAEGLRVACECAEMLADENVSIVSGYANGVDLTAHCAAIAAGGFTGFVLAEGILRFRPKPSIAETMSDSNSVVVSECAPRMVWNVGAAMQRNRTICGLSDAVIMVEPGFSGGTHAAGMAALALERPLFVLASGESEPSTEGIRYFLERGAILLYWQKEKTTGLSGIFRALENSASSESPNSATSQEHPETPG